MRGEVKFFKTREVFEMEKKPVGNEDKVQETDAKVMKKPGEMDEDDLNGVAGGEGMDTGTVIKPK